MFHFIHVVLSLIFSLARSFVYLESRTQLPERLGRADPAAEHVQLGRPRLPGRGGARHQLPGTVLSCD